MLRELTARPVVMIGLILIGVTSYSACADSTATKREYELIGALRQLCERNGYIPRLRDIRTEESPLVTEQPLNPTAGFWKQCAILEKLYKVHIRYASFGQHDGQWINLQIGPADSQCRVWACGRFRIVVSDADSILYKGRKFLYVDLDCLPGPAILDVKWRPESAIAAVPNESIGFGFGRKNSIGRIPVENAERLGGDVVVVEIVEESDVSLPFVAGASVAFPESAVDGVEINEIWQLDDKMRVMESSTMDGFRKSRYLGVELCLSGKYAKAASGAPCLGTECLILDASGNSASCVIYNLDVTQNDNGKANTIAVFEKNSLDYPVKVKLKVPSKVREVRLEIAEMERL